jgi:sigma54-dependent transcription regulator
MHDIGSAEALLCKLAQYVVHVLQGMHAALICLMVLHMQTLLDAQAALVSRTPNPPALA